ncbi:hypothetical protein BT67DRAFT_134338 [Trichocladium antarcticum]|uniref:Uncharacterized protein n=1 Tax=Trichocladium antarcticum TaxID=1450529 RepID=A0AAN6UFJ5_9PEZI|nr:hypothetical protein BT67DRAFT_134338 [Trichocladium antarcticum]
MKREGRTAHVACPTLGRDLMFMRSHPCPLYDAIMIGSDAVVTPTGVCKRKTTSAATFRSSANRPTESNYMTKSRNDVHQSPTRPILSSTNIGFEPDSPRGADYVAAFAGESPHPCRAPAQAPRRLLRASCGDSLARGITQRRSGDSHRKCSLLATSTSSVVARC